MGPYYIRDRGSITYIEWGCDMDWNGINVYVESVLMPIHVVKLHSLNVHADGGMSDMCLVYVHHNM